jgi:hypothetical protein
MSIRGSDHDDVGGVVEADGGLEHRAPRGGRVGDGQLAAGDTFGDDPGELAAQAVDMGPDHGSGLRGELDVGGEQLRVLAGHPPLGHDQQVEPAPRALRRRALLGRHGRQRRAEMRESQRSVTASRSPALLAKWR